jgi:hypothetical protein
LVPGSWIRRKAAGVGSDYVNCLFDFRWIGKKPGKEKEAQLLVATATII